MWMVSAWRSAAVPAALLSSDLWTMEAIDAQDKLRRMDEFKGNVLLISNVASRCKLAPTNMNEFIDLKDKYGEQGFEVLAFPTMQFSNQEEKDPAAMCMAYKKLNVNFPVFKPIDVNGPDSHPLFQYCKFHSDDFYKKGTVQPIGWNFGKFLVDRDGMVYKYYGPRTNPNELEEDIKKLLSGELKGKRRNSSGELS